jgi:hypothetical protein
MNARHAGILWVAVALAATVARSSSEIPKIAIFGWQLNNTLMNVTKECDVNGGSDCAIGTTPFSLDLLRITRLFNPVSQTKFFVLLDEDYLEKEPYYAQQLHRAQVELRPRSQYRQVGSRALAYEALHVKFGVHHSAQMESRFCEWADLAKAEGLDRVITIDSDVALYDDVDAIFKAFPEDIVTPCAACSQIVLWNTKALSNYCDGLIEFFLQPSDQLFKMSVKYQLVRCSGGDDFNDMTFLKIYLLDNFGRHNMSYVDLTSSPMDPRIPHPGMWTMGFTGKRGGMERRGEYVLPAAKVAGFANGWWAREGHA